MTQTRYCSTCGALLSHGAVICGECGSRFQESPFHKKATDAPSAWGAAPIPRSASEEDRGDADQEEGGVQLISRESLEPRAPGMTALRPGADQYDRTMVEQNRAPSSPAQHHAGGSPVPGTTSTGSGGTGEGVLERPLDGCVPAPIAKRFLAYLIDGVAAGIVSIPLTIGALLIALGSGSPSLVAQILVGIGVVLPLVLALVMIWLEGSKGLTIGKAALGLRTVRQSLGGPIGVARALGRAVLVGMPVIGAVMGLSVLLDPRRLGRGFHDRALDDVVLDIRAGRNGIEPRPDDFERQGAEHYLPSRPVEVQAHENLMAAPGAAWGVGSPAPAEEGWGQGPGASAAADQGEASWAPDPAPEPPAQGGWGSSAPEPAAAPAPAPAPEPEPAPSGWGSPAPAPAAEQSGWGSPAPAPASEQTGWGSPSPAPMSAPDPAQAGWGSPAPAPEPVAPAVEEDDEDDHTRIARPSQPAAPAAPPRVLLRWDDGTEQEATPPLVIGRNPAGTDGEEAVVMADSTRSVSKTHLRLEFNDGRILVTDLGSTNGTALVGPGDARIQLSEQSPTALPEGGHLELGERTITVEPTS